MQRYSIDPDIRVAATLPGKFYTDSGVYAHARERVFATSWQPIGDSAHVREPSMAWPVTLLDGCLDEPLLVTRDASGKLHGLSNVCTHRGAILVNEPCRRTSLTCAYHGRRFELNGKLKSAPEFEAALDFPRASDDLQRVELATLGPLVFAALRPSTPFAELIAPFAERLHWIPFDEFEFAPDRSRDYVVHANWALYCDNFLEGFHIPFVHPALNAALAFEEYATELHPNSSVQLGLAKDGELAFDPPRGSADHGRRIAGYYWWFFPNWMLNVYPWGLSMNVVQPLSIDRTRVAFWTYVWREDLLDRGAGSGLHQVELEDEDVVHSVQRGVRSRSYDRGRYSPTREQGVHHFHRMLLERLTLDRPLGSHGETAGESPR